MCLVMQPLDDQVADFFLKEKKNQLLGHLADIVMWIVSSHKTKVNMIIQ